MSGVDAFVLCFEFWFQLSNGYAVLYGYHVCHIGKGV